MSAPASKPVHTISVRDLVEFVLRTGDLGGEREFVGSDRALAGIRVRLHTEDKAPDCTPFWSEPVSVFGSLSI